MKSIFCPICKTTANCQFAGSPYWICPSCNAWFQSPMPPKLYEADHEKDAHGGFAGHLMSDHDKAVNKSLAEALFRNWMKNEPGRTLDIGSKYPYLAHCLKSLGCDAYGMDNIEVVPDYSKALGVPMLLADFEAITEQQIEEWAGQGRFKLITLVHVFEHMYEPLETLKKLKRLLADDGVLYLRLPSHDVSGFERDLTPGHFTIHPFFHSWGSILELLVQGEDLFTARETYAMDGAGQRDVLLQPLVKKPTVIAGIIAKNEERDIGKALRSIQSTVDGVVLVDTGSTDRTLEVAKENFKGPLRTFTYTDASEQDETGDWKIVDFSKARNHAVEEVEAIGPDYFLWFDADDELVTPVNLKRALYWSQYEAFGVQIENGCQTFPHHRLWKTGRGIRFEGACHEYPAFGHVPNITLNDSLIRHDAEPGTGEDSNARNLRILEREFAKNPTSRTAFYLANTHKDGGRFAEAVPIYDARIRMGSGFRDEWLFAILFKARCQRAAGDSAGAEKTLLIGVSEERSWAEFWMELAYMAQDQGRQQQAVGYALQAAHQPIPPTTLWREPNKYTDQPARIISWAYEHLKDIPQALSWAVKAKVLIGCEDEEWDARIVRLHSLQSSTRPKEQGSKRAKKNKLADSASKKLREIGLKGALKKIVENTPTTFAKDVAKIALLRPGAIGDVLMTLNLIPHLKVINPGREIHYFCDVGIGQKLEEIMYSAGIDEIRDYRTLPSHKSEFERVVNLIGYPLDEGYPDKPMRKHLLHYFADEMGVDTHGMIPSLDLPKPELLKSLDLPDRYATLQVQTGWSVYKNWPNDRWAEVLKNFPDMPVFQIGGADEPRIPGAIHVHMGSVEKAIALVSNAALHLGLDSFANHLTNYRWNTRPSGRVPGIILFGSTQASASGYPHNVNISLDLPCQPCFREDPKISRVPKGVCDNPPGQTYEKPNHACMNGISVERVCLEVDRIWRQPARELLQNTGTLNKTRLPVAPEVLIPARE